MPALVHAQEAKIAVLPHLAVLGAVDGERGVACSGEFGGVGIVDGERNGLAAEPVANVIGVAVVEGHADAGVEERFEVCDEVGVDEVAGVDECVIDGGARIGRIVEINP